MTVLVLDNLTAPPALVRNVGRWVDSSVSALAARSVPEWRLEKVQMKSRAIGRRWAGKASRRQIWHWSG